MTLLALIIFTTLIASLGIFLAVGAVSAFKDEQTGICFLLSWLSLFLMSVVLLAIGQYLSILNELT